MKYFIGIKNKVKQELVDLRVVDEKLSKDNNLRVLCTFTMTFKGEEELKQFLMARDIVKRDITKDKMGIVYRRKYKGKIYNYWLDIPYKKQEKYLNYGTIAMIIRDLSLKYPTFLKLFLNSYETKYNSDFKHYIPEEFYMLRNMADYADEVRLYDLIRRFVSRECYRNGKNGRVFSFLGLYNIAFTAIKIEERLDYSLKKGKEEEKLKEEENSYSHSEEIEGQTRLF